MSPRVKSIATPLSLEKTSEITLWSSGWMVQLTELLLPPEQSGQTLLTPHHYHYHLKIKNKMLQEN